MCYVVQCDAVQCDVWKCDVEKCYAVQCVPCGFPGSGVCGDEGDVEEVGEDDDAAVEREELLPLVPAGGAEAGHEDGHQDPGHGQGEDGGQPEQVPVEGGRDVPVGGVACKVAEHTEAGQALGKKESASFSSSSSS